MANFQWWLPAFELDYRQQRYQLKQHGVYFIWPVRCPSRNRQQVKINFLGHWLKKPTLSNCLFKQQTLNYRWNHAIAWKFYHKPNAKMIQAFAAVQRCFSVCRRIRYIRTPNLLLKKVHFILWLAHFGMFIITFEPEYDTKSRIHFQMFPIKLNFDWSSDSHTFLLAVVKKARHFL